MAHGEDSDLIRGLPEPEAVRRRTLRALWRGLHLACVAWVEPHGDGRWRLRLLAGPCSDPSVPEGSVLADLGTAAPVASSRRPLLLNPDRPMPLRVPYAGRPRTLAGAMAAPVGDGFLWADRQDHPFSAEEFESFQDSAKAFDELATLHERIRDTAAQVDDLTGTVEGARAVLAAGSERESVTVLADAAVRLARARTSLVYLLGSPPDEGVVVAGKGPGARPLAGATLSAAQGLVGLSLRSLSAVPTSLRFHANTGPILGTSTLGLSPGDGVVVHPLGQPDPIGALVLAHGDFDRPGLVHGIRTLCDCTALLIRQFRLRERVTHDAMVDGLTGLYNRRAFAGKLAEATAYAARHGGDLSLLMLDADHFKRVNDQHGHPAGDRVLQFIAETVRRGLRESDVAARYGGEEFVVLLPHTPLAGAAVVAERIRAFCAATSIPLSTGALTVTVSVGVASLGAGARRGDELVAAADAALYEAKRTGRNRVVCRS